MTTTKSKLDVAETRVAEAEKALEAATAELSAARWSQEFAKMQQRKAGAQQ